MTKVLKFPGSYAPKRRVYVKDNGEFFELRLNAILKNLDKQLVFVGTEKRLSAKNLFDFVSTVFKFLPKEQMMFLESMEFGQFDVSKAAEAFNIWVDSKHKIVPGDLDFETVKMRRDDRSIFGNVLRSLIEIETSGLQGLINFYETKGSEVEKYALSMILRYAHVDFEYFIDHFEQYLKNVESLPDNRAILDVMRKVVTSKVNLCLDRSNEETIA